MKTIETLICPLILFIWLIINTIYLVKKIKNLVKETNKNSELVVKCEKCQNIHTATIDDFFDTVMIKTKSITTSAKLGTLGTSYTNYKYYAKKFYCPTCNKKTWSEIKNYNKLAIKNTKLMFPLILKYFASLLIGGAIIMYFQKKFSL